MPGYSQSDKQADRRTSLDIQGQVFSVALIDQVAKPRGISVTVGNMEEMRDIMGYSIVSTPGVVINDEVVHGGGVPTRIRSNVG